MAVGCLDPAQLTCVFLAALQLVYVGWPFQVPEAARDYSIKGKFRVPANLHIGEAPMHGLDIEVLSSRKLGLAQLASWP